MSCGYCGQADWPRLDLHYSLSDKGQVIASGDEHLVDMAYMQRHGASYNAGALAYEQRLLSDWFTQRFAPKR